jgi:hypothetical protein
VFQYPPALSTQAAEIHQILFSVAQRILYDIGSRRHQAIFAWKKEKLWAAPNQRRRLFF